MLKEQVGEIDTLKRHSDVIDNPIKVGEKEHQEPNKRRPALSWEENERGKRPF